MKFKYQAKTKEGEAQVGFVDAPNRDVAANILATHNLFVLSLESSEVVHWYDRLAGVFGHGVKRKDMVVFTRQLSTLLEARLPLSSVLKTLHEQTSNPVLKEVVLQVSEDIEAGLSFSQALERQGDIFSSFFVSMVRSAEVTGNLESVVGFMAEYMEKEAILISKARSAMIYPAIVVGLFVIVAGIMVIFVFPQIKPVFEQAGVELPFFTKILLNSGDFLREWWLLVLLVFAVFVIMVISYFQTPEGRAFLDDVKIRFPVIRKIYLPITITRLSNTASMLLKGGVPVAQAVEISGQTIDNVLYRDIMRDVAEYIRQGEPMSSAIARYPEYFPPIVPQMLVVGEATGQIDQVFVRLAGFYGREADNVVNNIVDLIQPILMIGIGLMVGLLFASILLPLYQLTATIQ
jgi:type IV pilus assembly protein PilC